MGVRVPAVGVIAAVGVTLLASSGCGGSQDDDVRAVVDRFYRAVTEGDGAAACGLLTPRAQDELERSAGTECATAVLEEVPPAPGDAGEVEAFGTMAQVRLDGDTAFLARVHGGWRVDAAGCVPMRDEIFDCSVKGG